VKFTRRHARALAAGAATTAACLAAGRAAGSTPVRATGLLLLATTAIAGVQASALAKRNSKRMDAQVAATAGAVHLNNIHGTALNSLANNSTVLLTLAGSVDPTFLASITGPMGNQTTSNATISTTAGTFTNTERIAFNGLVNAMNTLQSHLQTANIEA
jgi:hypothetical protein